MNEELFQLCEKIFENLGFNFELDNPKLLYQADMYFEIYKTMFPFLEQDIRTIAQQQKKTGNKLQHLIDLLSSSVLTMDLSHIKGESIANGDQKHLHNFLQLLFELSRLFQSQNLADQNVRSTPISPNLTDQGDYHRNHSVMGINKEFDNERDYFVDDQDSNNNINRNNSNNNKAKNNLKGYNNKVEIKKEQKTTNIQKEKKDLQQQQQQQQFYKKSKQSDSNSQSQRAQSARQNQKQTQAKNSNKKGKQNKQQDIIHDDYGNELPFDLDNIDPELAQQYLEQMKQQGLVHYDDDIYNQYQSQSSSNQGKSQQASNSNIDLNKQKQIHRSKSTRDLGDQQINDENKNNFIQNEDSHHKNQTKNNKQNQIRALEQNIMPVTQLQHRVITTDPNLGKTKKISQLQQQKQQQYQQEKQEQEEQQEQQEEKEQDQQENEYEQQDPEQIIEDMSEVDIKFLETLDPEELTQLPEDHPVVQKYQRELEKISILEQMQQQQNDVENQNIDDIIEAQIHNVKNSLSKINQNQKPLDEKDTVEQIVRKRNEYKRYLKDYLKEYNQNQLSASQNTSQQNMKKKQKKMIFDEKVLKEEYENEHLSMYYKMRDEKLNYLRKIHRIIFELEKRKIIDEKKDHLQRRRQQNIATRNALLSIENAYNDRISILKDKLQQERQERHVASVAQKQILSKLERELKNDKIKQINQLKEYQKQEKERFEMLIRDDGQLEQKILQIYKKY